jgi:hypothetical protein
VTDNADTPRGEDEPLTTDSSDSLDLATELLSRPPREAVGAPTANRFGYHRSWALCELLRRHALPSDYVLVMEFHDDVLVLNSSARPTAADFYQIKTLATKMWKQSALLAQKRSAVKEANESVDAETKARSILGKLVEHTRRFRADSVQSLSIVSNARFDLEVAAEPACHKREKTCFRELATESATTILDKLKAELALNEEPCLDNLYFVTSDLSLNDHTTHGAGALAQFLELRKPGARFAVQPLYRTLCDELARKASREWRPTSFSELCTLHGITRSHLEEFLVAAENQFDPLQSIVYVKQQLQHEGLNYRELQTVEQAWRRHQIDRMDEANADVQALRAALIPAIEATAAEGNWNTLRELVDRVQSAVSNSTTFGIDNLTGAILFEYEVIKAGQVQTTSSKPKEET